MQKLDSSPPVWCAHHFFDKSSFMASISMSLSARSRLSLEFTPSSSLSFLASETIHAAVLVPPAIERLLGNPVLSANIRDVKLPALSFVQNANDLLLGKSLALHALCPSSLSRTLTYHLVLILGSRSAAH